MQLPLSRSGLRSQRIPESTAQMGPVGHCENQILCKDITKRHLQDAETFRSTIYSLVAATDSAQDCFKPDCL